MEERPSQPRYAQVAKTQPQPQAQEPRPPRALLRLGLRKMSARREASPTTSKNQKEAEASTSFTPAPATSHIESHQQSSSSSSHASDKPSLEPSSTPICDELFQFPLPAAPRTSAPGSEAAAFAERRIRSAHELGASWFTAFTSFSSSIEAPKTSSPPPLSSDDQPNQTMESYAQRRRDIWSHTRTRARSRRAVGILPPAPSSSSSTPDAPHSPHYDVAHPSSSSGSRLRYPVAAGDFVPSSSELRKSHPFEGLAFSSGLDMQRPLPPPSPAQSAHAIGTFNEEESMSGSPLAIAFEPYSRNVSMSRLPSYLQRGDVLDFHTPYDTFLGPLDTHGYISGSHTHGSIPGPYDTHGYFSDAPNLTLPTNFGSHVAWAQHSPVQIAERRDFTENQSSIEDPYATESRYTVEDTAVQDTADDPYEETSVAPPTPAWFYTHKVQTSNNIWAPDCEGERRLTDWPSFNELIGAGDERAAGGKDRRLPVPRYRNVDARRVYHVANGENPMAFATTAGPVPFLFRKYAVELTRSENLYPIPCDYDEEEARQILQSVGLS
ncbi:uncharacterized protein PG986_008860 [Apiospora aurea]|uniref:Uncharacterized protein n=1 Tax=Apiospora aurea TaxID=335848 RepID=A0ABR1Q601_9PEZI